MSQSKKIKISACVVVYHEEKLIARCLDSIKDLADEIIVVHDGPCHDKTLEISANYGAKIIIAPQTGQAEPIRPLSYSAASGEWILQIDGDEYLSNNLRQAIPGLILEDNIDAFEFLHLLYDGEKYFTKLWPYKRVLFRRSVMSYLGTPNDFVVDVPGMVKRVPFLLEHRPEYNNYSWSIFFKKWLPWSKLQAQLYFKDFSLINKFQYKGSGWPQKILLRRRFPLLVMLFDFFVVIIKSLKSGGLKEGPLAWRVIFMYGLLRIMIDWQIFLKKTFRD